MNRFVRVVMCVLGMSLAASSQIESPGGSVAIATWSKDEIVIAADSRESNSHSYRDSGCKILPFDGKLLFAATGRRSPGVDRSWDAYAVASAEYAKMAHIAPSEHLALNLATIWGEDVRAEFKRVGDEALVGLSDNHILTGLFSDFEPDETLLIVVSEITYEKIATRHTEIMLRTKTINNNDLQHNLEQMGENGVEEIVSAISSPRSSQEKGWQNEAREKALDWSHKNHDDDVVGLALAYTELVIEKLPKTKKDATGTPFSAVGLPIAAVRLTRGKGVDWIAKGKCQIQPIKSAPSKRKSD